MVESTEQGSSSRLDRLERIYEENPETRLFLALAEEYFRDGQLAKAVEVCRSGLEIFPGYTSARVTLARSLIDLGQDDEAEKELGSVLGNSPDNLLASRLFADMLIRQGRRDEAGPVVDRLLDLSPDDEEGLRLREKLAGVEQETGSAKATPPDDSGGEQLSSLTLARLYEEQGLHEKSLALYDSLLAEDPDNSEFADRVAAIRASLAENEPVPDAAGSPPAIDSSRRTIERLERFLEAARAKSRENPENV